MFATAMGGQGCFVRTSEELKRATGEGFKADVPVVVNVLVESGKGFPAVSQLASVTRDVLTSARSSALKRSSRTRREKSRCGGPSYNGSHTWHCRSSFTRQDSGSETNDSATNKSTRSRLADHAFSANGLLSRMLRPYLPNTKATPQ